MRLSHRIALCLSLLLPCAARADDIGPDQAKALQQQIGDWLGGLLGPGVSPPALSLLITGEGDHYRVTWPIPGLDNPGGDAAVSASVRPLDGGRWAIDGMNLPDEARFTVTIPDTGEAGAGGPTKVAMTIGRQDSHAVIDPTLASASSLRLDLSDLDITTDGPKQHQEQKIGRYAVSGDLKPAADGRFDVELDATMERWNSASRSEGGSTVAFGAEKVRAVGQVTGVSRERVAGLIAATAGLVNALPADVVEKGSNAEIPPAARAQLRGLIDSLSDLTTSLRLQETVDGLKVEVEGLGGLTLQHMLFGFGGEAPEGRLHAWIDVGLDGLETSSLPPEVATYLPHHIALRPSISGVPTADLRQLAVDASDEGKEERMAPDIAAIFAHGGIDLGIETLAFDLGPAKVEGVGHVVVASPDTWRGEARVTAEGFDALTDQARDKPELKQALPVLIMLRGLARPDGKRLVWNIVSENASVTVNGVDLSQLGGGDKKHQSGPPKKR